jgi:hypothetical protein
MTMTVLFWHALSSHQLHSQVLSASRRLFLVRITEQSRPVEAERGETPVSDQRWIHISYVSDDVQCLLLQLYETWACINLRRTLASSDLPSEVKLSTKAATSARYPCPPPVNIGTLVLVLFSSPPCMLKRTPATGIRNGRHQIVGTYVAIQGRYAFTVKQANLALSTAAFNAIAAADPIEFAFSPKSRFDAFDFRRPLLKLSQVKRILHPFRTVLGTLLVPF